MNTNSNIYTIIYASVMVVIVAFLLAFVSSSLSAKQNENVELDTKKQILAAIGVSGQDIAAEYAKYVKGDMLMKADGSLEKFESNKFPTSFEKEAKENHNLHVFVCQKGEDTVYVFPVFGAGLWGPIWGYIALGSDKNTVYGTYFSHASETPGLGAEIATSNFQKKFDGKEAMKDGSVALSVVKNGKVESPKFQVDGISGGTITSMGVNDMIKNCLGSYAVFLNNNKGE